MSVDIEKKYPRGEKISRNLSIHSAVLDVSSEDVTDGIDFDFEDYVRDEGVVIIENKDGYVFDYDYDNKVITVYQSGGDGSPMAEVEETITVENVHIVIIGTG